MGESKSRDIMSIVSQLNSGQQWALIFFMVAILVFVALLVSLILISVAGPVVPWAKEAVGLSIIAITVTGFVAQSLKTFQRIKELKKETKR
jgi:uncharacterized integral membrane protein